MTDVKAGAAADIDDIADALVKAFHDDPVMLHIFPKDSGREKKLRALFVSESKRALTRGALYTSGDEPAQGGAIWMASRRTSSPRRRATSPSTSVTVSR